MENADNQIKLSKHLVIDQENVRHFDGQEGDYKNHVQNIILGDNVREIMISAFEDFEKLENVIFSKNITAIYDKAFKSCSLLKTVDLPDSVRYLGKDVFDYCASIENVHLGKGLTKICEYTFADCINLKTVSGENIKTVQAMAFYKNSKLKTVDFPKLDYVEYKSFYNCESLEEISFNGDTDYAYIGEAAFLHCGALKTINGSNIIKYICEKAFANCYSLEKLDLEKIKSIGVHAFAGCYNLKHINFGDKLEGVEANAFVGCKSLDKETWLQLIKINPRIILESMPLFHSTDAEFMKQCRRVVLNKMLTEKDNVENRKLVEEISAWTKAGANTTYVNYVNSMLEDERDK